MTTEETTTRRGFKPDTLLASVVVLLLVTVVQRSIGFGRGILFCRWLEPEALGNWEMAYGFLLLAAPLAVLGLPGSFGRYLERYRQRGQLRMFLRRAIYWTAGLGCTAAAVLLVFRPMFAHLVFGDSRHGGLMALVAAVLLTVILHHFLEAVFAGLRVFRVVSCMQFAQSMLFAVISLSLLVWVRADAWSIVAGYGAACLIASVGVIVWSATLAHEPRPDVPDTSHGEFWPPLLRFAVWVWVANLLSNLFAVIDRYMIVHVSGLPPEESLALVGNYHTAMLLPALLVSIANLLVGAMTPHLSCDWEAGKTEEVSRRLNMALKFTSIGMLVAGIFILAVTPSLFWVAFEGKYDAGLEVLPWALAGCVWFSLLLVAQTYVWCAEKTRHATVPLAIGLASNVALNVVLLPRYGLEGALIATGTSTFLAVAVQLLVNKRFAMSCPLGTIAAVSLPLGLAFGLPVALTLLAIVGTVCALTNLLLDREEKAFIVSSWQRLPFVRPLTISPHPPAEHAS